MIQASITANCLDLFLGTLLKALIKLLSSKQPASQNGLRTIWYFVRNNYYYLEKNIDSHTFFLLELIEQTGPIQLFYVQYHPLCRKHSVQGVPSDVIPEGNRHFQNVEESWWVAKTAIYMSWTWPLYVNLLFQNVYWTWFPHVQSLQESKGSNQVSAAAKVVREATKESQRNPKSLLWRKMTKKWRSVELFSVWITFYFHSKGCSRNYSGGATLF